MNIFERIISGFFHPGDSAKITQKPIRKRIVETRKSVTIKERQEKMTTEKPDVVLKDFWRENARFADVFNAVFFRGKEIIKPEMLEEKDTDVSGVLKIRGYRESLSRARDVVKKTAFGIDWLLLGIENQSYIDYVMPLRVMTYDTLNYWKECKELARSNKKQKDFDSEDEFLSGVRKKDRLHPVVTLIIYYGEKPWDGPVSLKGMLTALPEGIEDFFSDYKMNLLEVQDSGKYVFQNPEVQAVFEISRETFAGHFEAIRAKYKDVEMSTDLLSTIGTIIGSKELVEMVRKGKVENMCEALEKLISEGKAEGIAEGIREGKVEGIKAMISTLRDLGIEESIILQKVMEKFALPEEEAEKYLKE